MSYIDTYAYATTFLIQLFKYPMNPRMGLNSYMGLWTFKVILLASPDPLEPATDADPDGASTGVAISQSSTAARFTGPTPTTPFSAGTVVGGRLETGSNNEVEGFGRTGSV